MSLKNVAVIPPIGIHGIQHCGSVKARERRGRKLPIGRIEVREFRYIRKFVIILPSRVDAGVDLDEFAILAVETIVPEPFHERIAGPGLTRERQVPSVFLKDEIATIEDNAIDLLELAQSPHTVKDELGRGSGPFLIRDHTHVRVHDVGLLHDFLSLLIFRRIAAIVASAISSNSLPKKSLG